MIKFFDKSFKFGVLFSVWSFAVFNIASYLPAIQKYGECMERMEGEYKTSNSCYLADWGFPFVWNDKNFKDFQEFSGILNIFIIILCSIAIGFLFKIIWAKLNLKN